MSKPATNLKLLPCPFCGGPASMEGVPVMGQVVWAVGCDATPSIMARSFECAGHQGLALYFSQQSAARAWNKRAPQPHTNGLTQHENAQLR